MGRYDKLIQDLNDIDDPSEYDQAVGLLRDAFGNEISSFCSVRAELVEYLEGIGVPGSKSDLSEPPFIVDDGEHYYALVLGNGSVKELPAGYELDDEQLNLDEETPILSTIAPQTPSGVIQFVPVVADIEIPGDDSFEIERLIETAAGPVDTDDSFEFDGLEFADGVFVDAKTGEPFSGIATLGWPNGQLKKEANFLDGKLNGPMTWWHQNGQKELEDNYVENLRDGMHRTWHENGHRWCEGKFVKGNEQGICRWWHENGNLAERTKYQDGQPDGTCERWFEDGTRSFETTFVDGVENGTQKEWYESGALHTEIELEDGEAHGRFRSWHENGVLEVEAEFSNGELDGAIRSWDQEGNLIEATE